MTEASEKAQFELWSRGDISRLELAERLGRELDFGDALLKLYEYGLPLPRPARNPEGVEFVRQLALRAPRA